MNKLLTGYITGVDDKERNFLFNAFRNNKNEVYLLPIEDAYKVFKKKELTENDDKKSFITERIKKAITVLDMGGNIVSVFEHRKYAFNKVADSLSVGDVFRSRVTRVEPYGAFIMIMDETTQEPLITGLLYKKDISENYVTNVQDLFEIGDELYVSIKDIDRDKLRIGLETKSLYGTWLENIAVLEQGTKTRATVHGVRGDEVFLELSPNVIALANFEPARVLEGATRAGLRWGDQVEVYLKSIHFEEEKKKIKVEIDRMLKEYNFGERYERPILVQHKKRIQQEDGINILSSFENSPKDSEKGEQTLKEFSENQENPKKSEVYLKESPKESNNYDEMYRNFYKEGGSNL